VRLAGVSVTAGAVPVPLSATLCGLPVALSEIWMLATREPVELGENVAEMLHVAFAASEDGQSLVCAKSPAFVPATLMLEIVSGAVPELRRVDDCAALVVDTGCEPNVKLAGVSVTAGAVPVPLSATPCGLPGTAFK